ncbi:MAG: hypothetical protein DMF87_02755 [Acidobacteria bacterium]|nr:MAG: hypothetical protein DMF88_00195 [Acidobacteriota bacterium]PYR82140.1 MAG: hypothetical protein DMF87_02755 [Acidobacteriota bacterium]
MFTTPENAWLREVGIGLRSVHVFATGSNISLRPVTRVPCPFSSGSRPPITYIFPLTVSAIAEQRLTGSGAFAV